MENNLTVGQRIDIVTPIEYHTHYLKGDQQVACFDNKDTSFSVIGRTQSGGFSDQTLIAGEFKPCGYYLRVKYLKGANT